MAAVDLTTHPGHLARRLQQAHYLLWNTMVSEEITSPQFAVLNALVAEPGLDQRTVGERVGLDRSTIAEVISRLGRRGLLDKVRDPQDGRRFLLRLAIGYSYDEIAAAEGATHTTTAKQIARAKRLLRDIERRRGGETTPPSP
jgi:predicted transcriptional regulator